MHAYLARYAPDLYSGTINPKPTDVWGPLNSDKVVEKYVGRMQTLSGPLGTLLVLWGADGSPGTPHGTCLVESTRSPAR
jgi:hypothetical protein